MNPLESESINTSSAVEDRRGDSTAAKTAEWNRSMHVFAAAPLGNGANEPRTSTNDPHGWAMLSLPVASGAVSLVIDKRAHLLNLLLTFVAIGTTIFLMRRDAKMRRAPANAFRLWGVLFFFAIAFPIYMHKRRRWGAPGRLPHALGALGIYLFGHLYPTFATTTPLVQVGCHRAGTTIADGYDCKAEETRGAVPTHTCFSVVMSCDTGVARSSYICIDAEPGHPGTAHVTPVVPTECPVTKARIDDVVVEGR
jgi:hypothetical protein